jgi:predicted HicB family RNase H-like nuclease
MTTKTKPKTDWDMFYVRIEKITHKQLKAIAALKGMSLQAFVADILHKAITKEGY